MNYPIQGLTIIAPIVFLVLMIGIPVIGVFAGWKRAAYWGGGTFFFFIVGMIIWKVGGTAIANNFMDMINNLLKGLGVSATTKLVASLAAPAFFLVVMMIAELLLLINYYAWFKKVAKIKQDVAAKKEYKKALKAGKKPSKSKVQGWTAMQLTGKGRAINMACGGAGMALLMAPSTIAFTEAIMYTTTSATTRANSAFCSGLYNSLTNTSKAFSWMSYYNGNETAKDYDSLFATLILTTQKIKFIDPTTGLETEEEKTIIEAVGDSVGNGISNIVSTATGESVTQETDPQKQLDTVTDAVDNFAASWNSIIDAAGTEVTAVFQSENVTEMFESIIPQIVGETEDINADKVLEAYKDDNSIFKQIVDDVKDGYAQGLETIPVSYTPKGSTTEVVSTITKLETIEVSEESFNNIKNSFAAVFDTSSLDETDTNVFNNALGDILSMLFVVA